MVALDVVSLTVQKYFVITPGKNEKQVQAIVDAVEAVEKEGSGVQYRR